MAVVSDFTKTPHQILLHLLNESNAATNLALAESAVTFGDITEHDGAVTEVTVTAASGSGYSGSVDVTYNRVDLGFMNVLTPSLVIETEATATDDATLLAYLNELYDINLVAGDLVSSVIPELEPDVNTPVDFTAEAANKIFWNKATINLTAPMVELASVVPVTTLDGLYAPEELPAG